MSIKQRVASLRTPETYFKAMTKTDRQQAVNELKEYAATVGENAVKYVEALDKYLQKFINNGQKLHGIIVLSDPDLWGYGSQVSLVVKKAKDRGIWKCPIININEHTQLDDSTVTIQLEISAQRLQEIKLLLSDHNINTYTIFKRKEIVSVGTA